jgi:circadian clock protein KaiC
MASSGEREEAGLVSSGVDGLDDVLRGGLPRDRLYLLEGDPGAGKTTMALQFLIAGAQRGESCLFIALSETEEELRASAASHGWSLDGIDIMEITASEDALQPDARTTMFHPSEVELGETMRSVLRQAEKIRPARMVFDSLSELRLLAEHPLRYRRQILALKRYFCRQHCTVLLVDDRSADQRDMHLYSLAHGVICLDSQTAEYGTIRRRLNVAKLRGRAFREGFHDFRLLKGGIEVYPRLVAAESRSRAPRQKVASGLVALDAMLGGGLSQGSSGLIMGAAGTGKSSLATQFAHAAAERGEHVSAYLFDESVATFHERSASLNLDVDSLIQSRRLSIRQIDAAELSPGEFAHVVRRDVEDNGAKLVLIDSLNGYLNAMPTERFLTLHLHELLAYLGQRGVTALLLMAQHGLVGELMQSPIDASYLADAVILLRYFEAFGEVRKAISVIKKRTGPHERTVRELVIDGGIAVGEPLREFHGVLSGVRQFVGEGRQLSAGRVES